MNIKKDAELIKGAIGADAERIAYYYERRREWLLKQANGEYPNFWYVTKKWVRSFGLVGWQKAEMFFNDFDIFKRELWREINGLLLPFPSEKEKELITIYNRLGLILEV